MMITHSYIFSRQSHCFVWHPLWRLCFLFCLSIIGGFVSAPIYADGIRFQINGLNKDLKNNAAIYLNALPEFQAKDYRTHQTEITESLENALKSLGYYQPAIKLRSSQRKTNTLIVDINPGKPVVIRSITIDLLGDAKNDPTFQSLLKHQPLKVGDVMNDGLYESLKTSLNTLALNRGYFDAALSRHEIRISAIRHSANIHLAMDAGRRYRFGEVQFGQDVTAGIQSLIRPILQIESGKPYQVTEISQLSQNLSATGYFKSVQVTPLTDQAVDFTIPIHVNVIPKTAWEIKTGIGFSTDEGPRVSLSVDKPWLSEDGHSFTSDMKVSKKVHELSGRYKIPYGNPLLEYYTIDAGYQRRLIEDTESSLLTTSFNIWKKRRDNWDQNFFIRTDYEDYIQGLENDSTLLLVPGVAFSRRKLMGNPTNPLSGNLYNFKLEASSTAWQSDADFVRLWGRAKWLTRFYGRHRLLARFEQGAIWVDDIESIPPSIRFFSGGDQTIRGYGYDSVAPKNSAGKLVGGQYLTVGSLEYNYAVSDNWRLALFVDKGAVTNSYKKGEVDWKTGVGPGIRWVSPLGPLRLDLAFAVSDSGSPWRIHFSVGPGL